MKFLTKKTAYYLYIILILGICAAPLMLFGIRRYDSSSENRTPAPFPAFRTQQGVNWDYLQGLGDYFTDRFAFREELVTANALVRSEIFGVSPVEDVIVGENGWLYYSATLNDYQHKDNVSERSLFNMAHNTALIQEYAESLGKTFLFTIAPNKNSLYGENMPKRLRFQLGASSDAERLRAWLEKEDVHYVDLFGLFEKQDRILYYARDSHWNEEGAVLVYNALLDACGKTHETYEQMEAGENGNYFGDLNRMLFPADIKPEPYVSYPISYHWEYLAGGDVEDDLIRTHQESGEGSLLMYRDSFGNSLLPYMAEAFRDAVFSKQTPFSMTDLVLYEPDIVILEKVERHLPTLGIVPPYMSGPVRVLEGERAYVESNTTIAISKEGSYWKLEGTADPACMDTDGRIYIEIDDGEGAQIREAFCTGTSVEGAEDAGDYEYILYISEILLNGDDFDIRVMTKKDDRLLVLLERGGGVR